MVRRELRRVSQIAVVWSLWMLVLAAPAAAQSMSGTVTDQQGGVLPGATLSLRNVDTGVSRTAVTESNGRYSLRGLPVGKYDLTVELPGLTTVTVKDLVFTISLDMQRDFTMSLQSLEESVTVTGQSPVVDVRRNEVAAVVTQQQIDSLPLASRQPISLALLLPGTSMDQTQVRRAQANIGAGGSSNTMNAYLVDGGNNWNQNSGQQHLEISQAAIQEFKVNISQAQAEYGAIGGVVVVATKSGTNKYSGEAFEFFRDESLNAMDKLQQERHDQLGEPKPEYRRHNYGAAFGGPIMKDRLHFFVAAERQTEPSTAQVFTGQSQFYSSLEGPVDRTYHRNEYFARGDYQITPQQSLFARYAYDYEEIGCESCGGTNAAFSGSDVATPRDSNVIGHTWVIGSRMLNEVRVQFPSKFDNSSGPPGLPLWPGSQRGEFPPERFEGYTQVFAFPSLTWGANSWASNLTKRREFTESFSVTTTHHSFKFGGGYLNISNPGEVAANVLGNWRFGADQPFNPADPASFTKLTGATQFTSSFPPMMRLVKNQWFQLYAQDEWQIRPDLTLNLGLRYDNQYKSFNNDMVVLPQLATLIHPSERGDNNNFGPRLGAAWTLDDQGRSVIRGAYGIAYQYVMQQALRNELNTLQQTSITIRNPTYPDPYNGRTPASFAATTPPNIEIVDDNIRNAWAKTLNLGYSQELGSNLAVHVDAVRSWVRDVTQITNMNQPDPVTLVRPQPQWGNMLRSQAGGEHDYKALFLRLDKRYSNRTQYLVSYTLSKQDNTGAGNQPTITDFYNPGLDFGPGSADRRHTFVASGSVLLPWEIHLGAVWTLRSSMPFSARAGVDLNNDGAAGTDYVPGTTRNMGNRRTDEMLAAVNAYRAKLGRAPIPAEQLDTNNYNRMDMRVSKLFGLGGSRRLELIMQVFNLLGSDNLGGIAQGWVENVTSDSFGRILSIQPRQQGEVAIRFQF